jgi:tRNA threonylcarbamoyladenosine biosynthesis protein TsaB
LNEHRFYEESRRWVNRSYREESKRTMSPPVEALPRCLIIETSGRPGQTALAEGPVIRANRRLDEARRHARDLAPAVAAMLAEIGWAPMSINAVIVSRGPGSYTGLRVGIVSAKVFAFATGARLFPVDTFRAIALQAGPAASVIDVIADAQQDHVYVQRFSWPSDDRLPQPSSALAIRPFAEWLASRKPAARVSGPGLSRFGSRLPAGTLAVDSGNWAPRPESLLQIGLGENLDGNAVDPVALEPLYMRPSSAEAKWEQQRAER